MILNYHCYSNNDLAVIDQFWGGEFFQEQLTLFDQLFRDHPGYADASHLSSLYWGEVVKADFCAD